MTNIVATQKTYFIIPAIELAGFVEAGQNITSPHAVEMYFDEDEFNQRKAVLGIRDEWEAPLEFDESEPDIQEQ